MSFTQYLKDTQGELRHVAWPTQTQTIVYTIFVVGISIATALYLGLFDYLFTSSLSRVVTAKGGSPIEITQQPATDASATPIEAVIPEFSTTTPGN